MDDHESEWVRDFIYLRSILTEDNNITNKIKQRTLIANGTSYSLKKQLSSQYLGRQTRCEL
jgi:hypothetical protein